MNLVKLRELIDCYELNYDFINSKKHNEIFKWKAAAAFRKAWKEDYSDFSEKISAALKDAGTLTERRRFPMNSIKILAKEYPDKTEALFNDILFAPFKTIDELQEHIKSFILETEKLRSSLLTGSKLSKQDFHSCSCYLGLFDPDKHYIYKYREAHEFAEYIEFEKKIEAGNKFRLSNYYELCDLVACELKNHQNLLKKVKRRTKSKEYCKDKNLHLLVFDIIYCSRHYKYIEGAKLEKEEIKFNDEDIAQIKSLSEDENEQILNYKDTSARIKTVKREVRERVYKTSVIDKLKKHYDNQCQICGCSPFEEYGCAISEAHHIKPFSESCDNNITNIVILCPNHHRLIHKLNATFDYEKNAFQYTDNKGKTNYLKLTIKSHNLKK